MIGRRGALIGAGVAAILLLVGRQSAEAAVSVITGRLTVNQVRDMAERIGGQMGVDPLMIHAIVQIESNRDPGAFRDEPHIQDASAGLMQTLLGTAQAMWDVYSQIAAAGIPKPQTWAELFDPETSMWHGTAYLKWLSNYGGRAHSEEWIVRGYNGGPGGATAGYTAGYYERFLAARARL